MAHVWRWRRRACCRSCLAHLVKPLRSDTPEPSIVATISADSKSQHVAGAAVARRS